MSAIIAWDPGQITMQTKLGNFVQYFQVNLPTNGQGVPLKLIDPVQLLPGLLNSETTDDVPDHIVDAATLSVEIDDGIPLLDGVPIWERWDGEQMDYYKAFKNYREMLYVSGSRAISKLSEVLNIPARVLSVLSKIYHWHARCRAYDISKRMEEERKRVLEIQKLEGKHARAANVMLESALNFFENHSEQLNHKDALQMMQLAVKIGRLAVGLNPDKPEGSELNTPAVNIYNTQTSGSGSMREVGEGAVNEAPAAAVDTSQLQSILHILDKSGALDSAKIVDAQYEVVEEDA